MFAFYKKSLRIKANLYWQILYVIKKCAFIIKKRENIKSEIYSFKYESAVTTKKQFLV